MQNQLGALDRNTQQAEIAELNAKIEGLENQTQQLVSEVSRINAKINEIESD